MKKWILISTIIHLLVLSIPFEKKDKFLIIQNNPDAKIISINIKADIVDKGVSKNSPSFFKKNKPNKKNESIENNCVENEIFEKTDNVNISPDEKKSVENLPSEETKKEVLSEVSNVEIEKNPVLVSDEILNSKPESDNNEVVEKISNTENVMISDNNEENSDEKEVLNQIVYEKIEYDENILSGGSVNLVKENGELQYKILESPVPNYPQKAKILNLSENIVVIAQFTVDLEGKVKDIILDSDFLKFRKYDFDIAVEKVLKKYKFTPIIYRNKAVEVRFKKTFEFSIK